MKNRMHIKRITLSAVFIALGWLLPFLTGQIPEIGNMLCPMHIPVFLSAFILGPIYGSIIGFILPLSRSLLFTMPVFYPNAICMSIELLTYGLISGLLFNLLTKRKNIDYKLSIYISLIISMLIGRIVWGFSRLFIGLVSNNYFTLSLFLMEGFINAWPGIILQLALVPLLITILIKTKVLTKI